MRRTVLAVAAVAASVLVLSGCATTAPAAPDRPDSPGSVPAPAGAIAAPGQVVGQGTVLQKDDEAPQFCLGAVAESYPPQCTGPEIVGWDWDAVDGEETASGVTWGAYAVTGIGS